jgi:hypothetical protein
MRRRRFSELEVLQTLYWQGVELRCYRCLEWLLIEEGLPREPIQREHIAELALGGKDIPINCAYSHKSCHAKVTNGSKATSAGSSKQRISKVKRLRGETKPKLKRSWPTRKLPSRKFPKRQKA